MLLHAASAPRVRRPGPTSIRPWRPARPPIRRLGAAVLALTVLVVATAAVATGAYLAVPAPTGELAVGRATVVVDGGPLAPGMPTGPREIPVVAWYPAAPGTGSAAAYVPGYERIRDALVASGELDELVVSALASVRTHALDGAAPADVATRYPVVVLSPGNATNVAFYASLAEDLASHGYVVLGLDHPSQVAAAMLGDGSVVPYEDAMAGVTDPAEALQTKIDARVADIAAMVGRIRGDAIGVPGLDGRLDGTRIAVIGHSNGGLAAVEACRQDAGLVACANIDGQAAGGPFGVTPDAAAPSQPFLFLTKEAGLHPVLADRFEAAGEGAYRVVVPAATHEGFADGARFAPRVLPIDGPADHTLAIERMVVRAFLASVLDGQPGRAFDGLEPGLDLYIDAYPLGGRPSLPAD